MSVGYHHTDPFFLETGSDSLLSLVTVLSVLGRRAQAGPVRLSVT